MRFEPFHLERWLLEHDDAALDLGASTGPPWTVRELLDLEPDAERRLGEIRLVYTHPHGGRELREEIATFSGVDPDDIVLTVGAQEALVILLLEAAEPGTNVVVPDPCYPPLVEIPRGLGIEVRQYRLRAEERFELRRDEVLELLDRETSLLWVLSPHNPTGAVVDESELPILETAVRHHGGRLVVDQVYHPIYAGREQPWATAVTEDAVVVGDLSKALSLSGLRTGWLVERDPDRRQRLLDLHGYLAISTSPLNEALAGIAIRHRDVVLGRTREAVAANRAAFSRLVASRTEHLSWIPPAGGTTAFPWLLRERDARPWCRDLVSRGVRLVPGDCFGAPGHVRIGLGIDPADFSAGLELLVATL